MLRVLVLLAALVAASPAFADDAPAKCRLVRIAEWPVRLVNGLPVVEGSINGTRIGVLVDTGAFATLVTKSAATRLDLPTRSTSMFVAGIGGVSRMLIARIKELRIAEASRTDLRVRVAGEQPIPGVDLVLGEDFLSGVDIEFDYAKGVVRLYQARDCIGTNLAYWNPDAVRIEIESGDHIVTTTTVNGREARTLIDSGAASSLVAQSFAEKVGIKPDSKGVSPAQCGGGIGADAMHTWVARFDSVVIGDETIRDAHLQFGDLGDMARTSIGDTALILGTDFLRAHRVLVARSQHKLYFSYTGGTVFPAKPGIDCDENLAGKNLDQMAALYDRAIAENPKDAQALLKRGLIRAAQRDYGGARADLDSVLALEPANGVAMETRAGVRFAMYDYAGALADVDAAIANGMQSPRAYLLRAGIHRSLGQQDKALHDIEEALVLDPHDTAALRSRARYLFNEGRFEDAEADLTASLSIRPNGFDSIWLFMARSRRGVDGKGALEQGLANLKDGQWPAPVMLFLLGRMDEPSLLSAAGTDEKLRKGRECEVQFYRGEAALLRGSKIEVQALFEQARDGCPRDYIEYQAALSELEKLR